MNLIFTMVGAAFRPGDARALVKELTTGTDVQLEPEPDNPYDENAVQVQYEGVHIGFVPKTDNGPLAAALAEGAEYTAQVIGFESTIKPVIEVTIDD